MFRYQRINRFDVTCLLAALLFVVSRTSPLRADEQEPSAEPAPMSASVEALTKKAQKAVVVITVQGRGRQYGLGSGFVVDPGGLIATNLHVIGEARPISVQFADGKQFDVVAVQATDRQRDLAIVRIDAKDLPALKLGDSKQLQQGQQVVALGNPRGLKHSVVTGNVSGFRELDGRRMIQLAIPIEPGNSGGPLLDMQGRVHGLLTMKSLVTDNLGFAAVAEDLKPLLEKPNPIPIKRWLTIGALDPQRWEPLFGATWTQRAGHILVSGTGDGFGGRSLCLQKRKPPETPYELTVTVKLDDEGGAAGLVFSADGQDRHYGFYPSNGRLRLSRFEGPSVFSWKVLAEKPSPHYRPGEWNTLRVRVEPKKILCYVNDALVIESTDDALAPGRVGLAKFRETAAQFKRFAVGKEVPSATVPEALAKEIARLTRDVSTQAPLDPELVAAVASTDRASSDALRLQARALEARAVLLRQLAERAHAQRVQTELAELTNKKTDDQIDLLRAALSIARMDNEDIDVAAYEGAVRRMAEQIAADLPEKASDQVKLLALNKYLFEENGFHGSRTDYYNRSNSYLSEVIDDREGLPITLSVLYMELGRRLGMKIEGVGLPGHFIVRFEPAKGQAQLVDPFERGKLLGRDDAAKKVRDIAGVPLRDEHLAAVTKRQILIRMLTNLLGLANDRDDPAAKARYLSAILAIEPSSSQHRLMRALVNLEQKDFPASRADVQWILQHEPEGIELGKVRELRDFIDLQEAQQQ